MYENLRLTGKLNGFEMAGALCASLTFHVLLVLILASTSVYYPATGAETRFDVIWATPSALPVDFPKTAGGESHQVLPGLAQETVESKDPRHLRGSEQSFPHLPQARADSREDLMPAVPTPKKGRAGTKIPVIANIGTEPDESIARRLQPTVPPGVSLAKLKLNPPQENRPAVPKAEAPQGEALQTDQKQASSENGRAASMVLHKEQIPAVGGEDRDPRQGQRSSVLKHNKPKPAHLSDIVSAVLENAKKENLPVKVPARKQLKAKRQTAPPVRTENAVREHNEREISSGKELEGERKAAAYTMERIGKTRLTAVQQVMAPAPGPAGSGLPGARPPTEPQTQVAPKFSVSQQVSKNATAEGQAVVPPPRTALPVARLKAPVPGEKPHQPRGPVIAALHGDLKLVMTGDTCIKVTVKFRDYPKSRRSRVFTRSEVRREQTVTPLLAAPREDTREAVIQTAREGIYLLSAEPAGGHAVRATFTLKVFESGARERIAPLGNRSLSGPTVLVKILMPEAILWDDESAFTGSMEDSESETKFNATTGLYWKEYRD
jgi:hypothetical protein